MIINKIESKLIKSVSVMLAMFILQLSLYNTHLYTHLQAQYVFSGSLLIQIIASFSSIFLLGWFLIDILKNNSERICVNDNSYKNHAAKKKVA